MITKQQEQAAKTYLRETPQQEQALGWVTSGKFFPGKFRFMPILGWVADPPPEDSSPMARAMREKFGPLQFPKRLILSGALLKMVGGASVGLLDWSIPVTERMEETVFSLLATFGWDLRVWPNNDGWPDAAQAERIGLRELLMKKKLNATMTFPPSANGNRVMTVHVLKVSKPFPLPPIIEEADRVVPSPELGLRFRSLTTSDFR